ERSIGAQQERIVVAAIDVAQTAARVFVIGKEEGGEAVFRDVFAEQAIHRLKQQRQVVERQRVLAADVGLEIGHQQRSGDALSRNVRQDDGEAAGAQIEEVVVVAADDARLDAAAGVFERGEWRHFLREEFRLHFAGNLDLEAARRS